MQDTNVIANDFKHGENFTIGHHCIIQEGCVVGDGVTIENFVLLKKGTIIGDNTFVDSYVKSSGDNSIGSNVTLRKVTDEYLLKTLDPAVTPEMKSKPNRSLIVILSTLLGTLLGIAAVLISKSFR